MRIYSLAGRLVFAAILACGWSPAAAAQRVTGVVVDSATRRPLSGVTIVIRRLRDSSTFGSVVSDSLGAFAVSVGRPELVDLTARRIGFRPFTTAPFVVEEGAEHPVRFAMIQLPVMLDTVRVEGTKKTVGFLSRLTAGQVWYAKHYADAKGYFSAGPDVLMSGMDLCNYLIQNAGFHASLPPKPVARGIAQGPALRCTGGNGSHAAIPDTPGRCVEAYIDRKYPVLSVQRLALVTRIPGFSKTKTLTLSGIRGIEVFMNFDDRPDDFSYLRPESPSLRQMLNGCALVLFWTDEYWGGRPKQPQF